MPNQSKMQNSTAANRDQLCNRLIFINRTVFFAVLLGIVLSAAPQTVSAQSSFENRQQLTQQGVSEEIKSSNSQLATRNSQLLNPEIESLILKGNVLETPSGNKQVDWNEALNFWESALRDYPSEAKLLRRYYRARIQYDVNCRLADRRYVELVDNMPFEQGKQTVADILYKIDFSYVDKVDWNILSHNGLVGFSLALRNPAFRSQRLAHISLEELASLERRWIQYAQSIPVNSAHDAFSQAISLAASVKRDCQINEAIVLMEYICGILNVLDQYTCLLTPTQFLDMTNQINGEFVGIGVELKTIKGELKVVRPITGSPAQKAGILPGDSIV
ncbi:MAG: hypothetical protein IKW80_09315, partial [Thermoguttaceae bacterium]|nr:hypothetical protein [Thermoguttaceae bacterium]